jgi:alpha-N-arabinofuranosidase
MRDALLTGITFDIFHRHADKVGVAAVAQSINCIHSLMLAQGDKFCVTPTYHVFRMYLPHHGAQAVRAEFMAPSINNPLGDTPSQVGGNSYIGQLPPVRSLAGLSGSASLAANSNGKTLNLTVINPHLTDAMTSEISVRGATISSAKGTVLAEKDVHAHNDFANPKAVEPRAASAMQPGGGRLVHTFPPASVTALEITLT